VSNVAASVSEQRKSPDVAASVSERERAEEVAGRSSERDDWLLEHRPPGIDYSRLEVFRGTLNEGE